MDVVVHDHVGIDVQTLVSAAVVEGIDDDVAVFAAGKDRYPLDGGGGDEVEAVGVVYFVARSLTHPLSLSPPLVGGEGNGFRYFIV
jgi:hypothetical protein